jgi:hypothetical protein
MVKKLFGLLLPFAIIVVSFTSCDWIGDIFRPDYVFDRTDLDKYVEVTEQPTQMNDGNAVYFDMSDGMNAAYADDNSKAVLQGIVNSIAGKADCFGLANNQISPIEKSHTELYNYLLNSKSYSQISAPVQKTLETIVENNQPALLLTDYEEYNNGRIQKAAYAKEAFTAWLKKGHKITFYKWNFTENGKEKMMFLTVFDDNSNSLGSLIENAVKNLEDYVLGGKDFAFPAFKNYVYQVDDTMGTKKPLSVNQGGNYHNSKGKDAVTVVLEKGDAQSYKSYCEPLAVAGGKGAYTPLNTGVGALAEYYPFCEAWENILTNAKSLSSNEIPEKDRFTHLLSNLYVKLNAQHGYNVSGIEARVFDITKAMEMCAEDSVKVQEVQGYEGKQVFDFLTATYETGDYTKISVDFDQKFKASSKFEGAMYRVDIVISAATSNINNAKDFFYWEGNPSLATSVEQVLLDTECNPQGHVLYTYYIKNIAY